MTADIAALLGKNFIERRDVKAWQQPDGAYFPDRTKLTMSDLRAHVACERTMGHYLISAEDRCRVFCFDIDLAKTGIWGGEPFEPRSEFANPESPYREGLVGQLVIMAEGLARRAHRELGIPVAIAFSGSKGVHVYGFTGPEGAAVVRACAQSVLTAIGSFEPLRGANFFRHQNPEMSCEVEVFPKQDSLEGKDLGNLLRLPLGVNLKSGKPGMFLSVGGDKRSTFKKMDAEAALTGTLPWTS